MRHWVNWRRKKCNLLPIGSLRTGDVEVEYWGEVILHGGILVPWYRIVADQLVIEIRDLLLMLGEYQGLYLCLDLIYAAGKAFVSLWKTS
jgi:hypothetical protein